jgi:hypothetical protein
VQVKSSQNRIDVPDVKGWAEDLEKSFTADEYEIRLIGPVSDGVPKMGVHGKVTVPVPEALNLNGLVYQAAHHLARYMEAHHLDVTSASAREMIVDALVTRLSTYATQGKPVKRSDFDSLLVSWISEISAITPPPLLPSGVAPAVRQKLQEVIWQSRSQAFQDLQAMARDLINSASPDAEDWSDACEDMATEFEPTLARLKQVYDRDSSYLSTRVREAVRDAIGLCYLGIEEVHYPDGAPEVSLKGREVADQLYELLKQARDLSAKEIREAAGVGDGEDNTLR